jgi:hypothetical protein
MNSATIGIVGKSKVGKDTVIKYLICRWNVILTVVVTLAEMHRLKEQGGILLRINRPQSYSTQQQQQHKEVDCGEALKLVDYHISNTGTVDELYKRLDELAAKLALQPIANAESIKIEPPAEEDAVPVIEMKMTTVKIPAKKKLKKGKKR